MALKKTQQLPIGGVIDQPGSSREYKTGTWRSFRPLWDKKKCIQCLLCVRNCPENCIMLRNGKRSKTDLEYCKGCGICAQVCPVKAIVMKKE